MDPNRVLDIMLHAFEFHPNEEDFFIALLNGYLHHYEKSTLCHILGFKYQFYKVKFTVSYIYSYFIMCFFLVCRLLGIHSLIRVLVVNEFARIFCSHLTVFVIDFLYLTSNEPEPIQTRSPDNKENWQFSKFYGAPNPSQF